MNTFPLEVTEGKWANGHEGYLPGNRGAAARDETLESEVMGCDRGALAQHVCGSHRLRTNLPAIPGAHASPDPLFTVGQPKFPHRWVRPGDPHIPKRRRPEARRPEAPLSRRRVPRDPHAQGTGSEPGAEGSEATCGLYSPLGSVSPWAGQGADHVPSGSRRGLTRGAPRPDRAGERRRQSQQCGKIPVSADGTRIRADGVGSTTKRGQRGKNRLHAHSDGGNAVETGLVA